MHRLLTFGILLLTTSLIVLFGSSLSRADELDDVTKELNRQQQELSNLEKKQKQLSSEVSSCSASLSQVSSELSDAETKLTKIEKDLTSKETELTQWEEGRNSLVRMLYEQSRTSLLEVFLSSNDLGESAKQLQYYDENLNSLEGRIVLLAKEVTVFEGNKASAEKLRGDLATLRSQYQACLASSQRQLSSTSAQLSQVKSTIKNLTAKQEQLILAKFAAGGGSETVGDNPPPSESIPNPSFSGRPAFMIGSYGYAHRIGMSQYGAYGRAKMGQDYKEILSAYFKVSASSIKDYKPSSTIHIKGCSSGPPPWISGGWSKSTCQNKGYIWYDKNVNFESYIKGLGEMPTDWGRTGGMEALKAQAVAARSFAWAYANGNGGTICPSTNCQVWLGHEKGSYWNQAVDETKNKTIIYNGSPLKAFYHSTAGGYTISTKTWINYWDYNDGISDFCTADSCGSNKGKAYEQVANAPWYHTGWGSRNGTKGEYQPWLTEEEFADIFNVLLLCTTGGQTVANCSYMPSLSPIDQGGWSMSKVRSMLSNPVTSVSKALVTFISSKANTQYVYVYGSSGSSSVTYQFTARDFLAIFNLRARGTLMIPWTYRFDIGSCTSSSCTSPVFK